MNFSKMSNYSPRLLYNNKRYAVNLPFININGNWEILFEVRSCNISQGGDICLPGGRAEGHESSRGAAIRETVEELGISEDRIEFISGLDYQITSSGGVVKPFLTVLDIASLDELCINEYEVCDIFTVPVSFFVDNEPDMYMINTPAVPADDFPYEKIPRGRDYDWGKRGYETYFYEYEDRVIWGLTACIVKSSISTLLQQGVISGGH